MEVAGHLSNPDLIVVKMRTLRELTPSATFGLVHGGTRRASHPKPQSAAGHDPRASVLGGVRHQVELLADQLASPLYYVRGRLCGGAALVRLAVELLIRRYDPNVPR